MSEVEQLERDVREAMSDLVANPVTSSDLFDRVAGVARRRRRTWVGGVALLVVFAGPAGLALTGLGPGGRLPLGHRPHLPITVPACPSVPPNATMVRGPNGLRRVEDGWLNPPATPGLHDHVVPGSPTRALVCQYSGLNETGPRGSLTYSRTIRDEE